MSRVLHYSKQTIQRRILALGRLVKRPVLNETNQVYEIDEMWTYVGINQPEHYAWITYAINRHTKQVVNVSVGKRNTESINKVVTSVKCLNPKKIVTDKLNIYRTLLKEEEHDTGRYRNNRIERSNLTLRQHIKRLSRKTLSFSRKLEMLEATVLLYFFWNNWKIGFTK